MKSFWTLSAVFGAIALLFGTVCFAGEAGSKLHTRIQNNARLFKITGTGLHRPNEEICNAELRVFHDRLNRLGYAVQSVKCQPVEGEPESFEPRFIAYGRQPAAAETAEAIHFANTDACKQTLSQLLEVVQDDESERIVESGCVPMHILDPESGEYGPVEYQPMVILLKPIKS